jgi:hypothetical protein
MDFNQKLHLTLFESDSRSIPTIAALLKSEIPFVVVGARAANIYSDRPRSTLDIDVLSDRYEELAKYVASEWPSLTHRQTEVVIQFKFKDETVLDIMKPYDRLMQAVLTDTKTIKGCQVASAEALVAMKFAAIMGSNRQMHRKIIDRGDIASILVAYKLNMEKAKQYASLLYRGAGEDFLAFMLQLKRELKS